MEKTQYLTIKQIAEESGYPFTLAQLRHYLSFRHRNGLSTAIRKIGKRLFIRKDLFDSWIEQQRGDI